MAYDAGPAQRIRETLAERPGVAGVASDADLVRWVDASIGLVETLPSKAAH